MAFARARALRTLQSSLRQRAVPRVSAPARTQLLQRRYASGGGHDSHASGSDLPWAIGAVVVTIPSCWYLWPDSSHADAGHHGGHGEHEEHEEHAEEGGGEKDGEQKDEAPSEEATSSDSQPEQKDGGEGKSDEGGEESKPSEEESKDGEEGKSDDEGKAKPESGEESKDSEASADAPAKDNSQGTSGKGKISADADGATNTRKVEQSPKGGSTIRLDSNARKELGSGPDDSEATSRNPKKSDGDISTKQSGLSNTPTRHSLQIDEDPTKSTKPEGTPETAKAMGTVDPGRAAK